MLPTFVTPAFVVYAYVNGPIPVVVFVNVTVWPASIPVVDEVIDIVGSGLTVIPAGADGTLAPVLSCTYSTTV